MNADAFRHFYNYHFAENHNLWVSYVAPLSYAEFTRNVSYSMGSVRSQVVHLMNVDEGWFNDLRGVSLPEEYTVGDYDDREAIRAHWDTVEQGMRAFLADLRDDMLFEKPFDDGEDKELILWQILLHVGNHGTDHRAQLLRMLNDMGVKTVAQDYIFYVRDNP